MKQGQEVFCLPRQTIPLYPVIYKGPAKRNPETHSTISWQGCLQPTRTDNLFETKKEALEELLRRLEETKKEVQAQLAGLE